MPDVDLRSGLTYGSLCSGGGGLDRALELACPGARPGVYLERESFACASLVEAMVRGVMAPAPIWTNVRTFRGRAWRGLLDGIIGGIPCQPHSLAGLRLGQEDERDLWSDARRIIVQSGAWFFWLENVPGMLTAKKGEIPGARRVWRDLRRMGFEVEAGLFSAEEIGFTHARERLFLLAVSDARYRAMADRDGHGRGQGPAGLLRRQAEPPGSGEGLADSAGIGGQRGLRETGPIDDGALAAQGGRVADPAVQGRQGRQPGRGHRLGERAAAERGRGRVDDPSGEDRSLYEGQGEEGRGAADAGWAGGHVADAAGDGRRAGFERQLAAEEAGGPALAASPDEHLVDSVGGGRDGWPHESERSQAERAAIEWAGQGRLYPPEPAAYEEWAYIAERYPERLPAFSRYDLFRNALRNAGVDPDERPGPGQEMGSREARAVRAAFIQAIAQSHLRRRPDGLATRIDELRMLGNGVVPLAGAYAFRTLAADLARRSAGAAHLVRMMEGADG